MNTHVLDRQKFIFKHNPHAVESSVYKYIKHTSNIPNRYLQSVTSQPRKMIPTKTSLGVSPPCHNSNNSLGPEEHFDGLFFAVHRAPLLQHFGLFVGELFKFKYVKHVNADLELSKGKNGKFGQK